jgi:hypothetical protein
MGAVLTADLRALFAAEPRRLLDSLHIRYGEGNAWFCPLCQKDGPPFHKTPDLKIKGPAIRCFKCGGAWDCFKLVKELCGVDFPEAQRIVAAAYGLADADAPKVRAAVRDAKPPQKRAPKEYATRDDAIAHWLERHPGWRLLKAWRYNDGLFVCRMQNGEDKDYRPVRRRSTGKWVLGAPKPPRPLYIPGALRGLCACVEGEKCADALHAIGLAAVTSMGGASAARMADWTPLAGRRVLIIPDRDDAGRRYAEDVQTILEAKGCVVSVREPPVAEGEDVADFVARNRHRPAAWLRKRITGRSFE